MVGKIYMKNLKLIAFAVGLTVFGFGPAFADVNTTKGNADSATTSVGVNMVCPLQVSKTQDLSFGRFTAGASGGTVVVAANTQARTVTGTAVAMLGGTVAGGRVSVTGANIINGGPDFTMVLGTPAASASNPSAGITLSALTNQGGTNRFEDVSTYTGNDSACVTTGRNLGGTLSIANGTVALPGTYSWTYTFTATYN
jgi:hypothetical protein